MDSMQAKKEERAEAGATEPEQTSTGVLGSILKSVGETYDHVKEAVTAKNDKTIENTQRSRNVAAEKESKPRQDAHTEEIKIDEYQDYAAEKAKEPKDTMSQEKDSMTELKETAAAAAARARGYFTGRKQEAEQRAVESGEMAEKYRETKEKARQKMEELKLKEEGMQDEPKQRAEAELDTAADRGLAARSTIYGARRSLTDAIKEKLTYPSDVVQQARAAREHGGPKQGEKMVDDAAGTSLGPAAGPSTKATAWMSSN